MASLLNKAIAQTAELRRSVAERMYPKLPTNPPTRLSVADTHLANTHLTIAERMYPDLSKEDKA
jgi:hypothetical protein